MHTTASVVYPVKFSVIIAIILLGCKNNSFKDFAAFHRAPIDMRKSAILKILKMKKITDDKTLDGQVDRLLTEDQIVALLDIKMSSSDFANRFENVVPLAYQSLRPNAEGQNLQEAKEITRWFINQYGIESTESFLLECERLGGNVSVNRVAVSEFKKAMEEEKLRRFEATWGTFSAWSVRPENAQSLSDINALFNGESKLNLLRTAYDREKAGNDRQVRPARTVQEPIYHEVRGAYGFVKILDSNSSESLFSAADGLFVLQLSEGYSFQAYPGQSIRMTMHSRGEKMQMTNGSNLPVFHSGPSPTEPREIPGYEPNRSEENQLAIRCSELDKQLTRIRQDIREDGSGRFVLEEAQPIRLVFERQGTSWQRVIIQDSESRREMYCASMNGGNHPKGIEEVDIQRMFGNTMDSKEKSNSSLPVASNESNNSASAGDTTKNDVKAIFESWIDQSQQKDSDLSPFYADVVNYYLAKNYLKSKLIWDKSKFWVKYTSLKLNTSNIDIFRTSSKIYTINYNKHYEATNKQTGQKLNGDVHSIVIFEKNSEGWKIITEKDIKRSS